MTNIKNQNFGVEVEFTGITRPKAADALMTVLNVSRVNHISSYDSYCVTGNDGRVWKISKDVSVGDGNAHACELVTPICTYEDLELIQNIVREIRAKGGKADFSCGIHVHVDGANHNAKSLRRLVKFFANRQKLIYEGVEISRNRAEHWCCVTPESLNKKLAGFKDITISDVERTWYSNANTEQWNRVYYGGIDHSHYNSTRYHGLNIHAFFQKGTVEFRLFNGTLHAGKIKAYIQFCLALSAWAINANDSIRFAKIVDSKTFEERGKLWASILTDRLNLVGNEFKTCRKWIMAGYTHDTEANEVA